jgi:asparagine synthase (glutamine-hydrolysing)
VCGIAGLISLDGTPVSAEELRLMCDAMVHRGPDDEGSYVTAHAGIAMRRLAIIDLDTGRQPIANEDGSVQVVLNGEIYNYRELRAELLARGHRLYTTGDTEVIGHLYEDLGDDCLGRLRGMFGLAVWDERRRRLLLARDRLGIKPLYYGEIGGRLAFASELKAILALGQVDRQLDWEALGHYLTFSTTPRARSIVAGVKKLEPGHLLVAQQGQRPRVERYWDVRFEPDRSRGEAQLAERLAELLEESVRLHLVSDVPLGAFLSGGMDSSSVVAAMARQSPAPVKTFSIGFAEPRYNELGWASLVAGRFGTEHHQLVLEPDVLDIIEDLAWHLDEPFGDSSAIPTYMVSKLAAESVTVVLSGDGGDELFGGYDKYAIEARERRYRLLPGPARRLVSAVARAMPDGMRGRNYLRHISLPGLHRYLDAFTLFGRERLGRLLSPDVAALVARHDPWEAASRWLQTGTTHWLSALQYADLHTYLPLDILTKVDRMSMAHSIEARVPLLDHKLVEFAASIPPDLLLRNGTGKHLFKRAMRGVLPEAVLDRPKRGFAIPLGHWFRGRLAPFVRDLLLSERSRTRGLFERPEIERILERPSRGMEDLDLELWTLISLELWCRLFLDGGRLPVPARATRARRAGAPAGRAAR